MQTLALKLRSLRVDAGMTQPQLAERAGIEQGYLSKLENGRATPSAEVVERLAEALGVPLTTLADSSARRWVGTTAVAAVAVAALTAWWALQPAPIAGSVPPEGVRLNVALAYDATPPGVEVLDLSTAGEPAEWLFISGLASDEQALRAYLEVLEQFGEVASLNLRPQPWWHFGGISFNARLRLDDVTVGGDAGNPVLDVRLHTGSEAEQHARDQLLRLLSEYDLEPWLFTRTVRIRAGVIPHSHPVLTLNPGSEDDDIQQLSTFIHEQLHWHEEAHRQSRDEAISDLRSLYPEVPTRENGGARDESSTYLHLIVCWLELDAMTRLLGEERARATLAEKTYYEWVYARVLEDTAAIGAVLQRHGLVLEPSALL